MTSNSWEFPSESLDIVSSEMTAEEIDTLITKARKENDLSEIEEKIIREMSIRFDGKSLKQMSKDIDRTTWYTYNKRRSGIRKIAKMLEIPDEEDMFAPLGLKRGHRLPRSTRFPPKKEEKAESHDGASREDSPVPDRDRDRD